MNTIKKFLASSFENFYYFYSHLGFRVFVTLIMSISVGVLDGLGLSMFLPLLQIAGGASTNVNSESFGKVQYLIDILQGTGVELSLLNVLLFMCLFFLMKGLLVFLLGYYVVNVQQYFIRKIRVENIEALNKIGYNQFVHENIGQIQNTLTGEVDRVANAFNSYFLSMQHAVLMLVYVGFAFLVDFRFALLVTVGGGMTNFIFKIVYKYTKSASRKLTSSTNSLQGLIVQYLSNYKYLKATGFLHKYSNQIIENVDRIQYSNKKIGVLTSFVKGAREPIIIFVVAAVIFIQAYVWKADLAPVFVSLLFFYRSLTAVMGMQTSWNYFLSNSGSLLNMTSFTRRLRAGKEDNGSIKFEDKKLSLEIENGKFYANDRGIIDAVSLKINKGETVAFVGESGSGKTTLVNILTGLLPLSDGVYKLGDNNFYDIDRASWQAKIGYITQEPVIFNDTVFNNVTRWSEPNIKNMERFNLVMKQVKMKDFLDNTSLGYNTLIETNGMNLSGGQRQRISIARELFRDEIELLILDEATSALDTETESYIHESIEELRGKYTILIIAHRLSTIKNADTIYFLKNGKIVSAGDFFQLIEREPAFKKMVELQEL